MVQISLESPEPLLYIVYVEVSRDQFCGAVNGYPSHLSNNRIQITHNIIAINGS